MKTVRRIVGRTLCQGLADFNRIAAVGIITVAMFFLFPSNAFSQKASPEIDVFINDVLVRGTRSSQKLAATYTSGPGRAVTFKIRNSGRADLIITNWIVPKGFTGQNPGRITISPGKMFTYILWLDLSMIGIKDGTLSFSTNDVDERDFKLNLRGKVLQPAVTSSNPLDKANSLPEYTKYESRPGAAISIDIPHGIVSQNTRYTISDNLGSRQHFDGRLRKVIVYAGAGVTVEDWTTGNVWPPIEVIVRRQ